MASWVVTAMVALIALARVLSYWIPKYRISLLQAIGVLADLMAETMLTLTKALLVVFGAVNPIFAQCRCVWVPKLSTKLILLG